MESTATRRVRAVILTTQRTGSTFLVDCLGSHPEIECASEILVGDPDVPARRKGGHFKKVVKLTNFITSGAFLPGHRMADYFAGGSARVRMFKVMYNHLANPFALRYLQEQEDIRIVHLRRHNLLKVYVSKLLMPKRAQVQVFSPVDAVQVYVDPAEAIASMRVSRRLCERYERLFERHRRLPVTYEELFDGQQLSTATAARISEFLDVAPHPMKSGIIKLNPESLRDMVVNFQELADAVAKTEFADMLEGC